MGVFEHIAKGLYVAAQLPLDAKAYFPTLTQLKDLGISNYNAFTYYEWLRVTCVETDSEFVWKEVDVLYTGGALDDNFQYPVDTLSNGVDYSNRYFNFVPYAPAAGGSEPIARPYVIYKHPNNPADY